MKRPAQLRLAVVLLLMAAVALAVALERRRADSIRSGPAGTDGPSAPRSSPAARERRPGSSPVPLKSPDAVIDDLRAALASGSAEDARRAAAALRNRLREDPEAWRRAAALLLAIDTPPALREALALVLGTIDRPGADALLIEALRLHGADASSARCLLLALGATREPEDDDDVFGLGDRPHGASVPGGLGITVRRSIDDPATRAVLAQYLASPEPPLREAAARSLRHSLASADARASFLTGLARETSDDVAPVLGEALAERAGATEDAGEREVLVTALLARSGDEGFDTFRFRIENDFRRIPLGTAEREALADLASDARPFGTRAFALTALANAASLPGVAGMEETRALLGRFVARDPEAALRDVAARLLREVPPGNDEIAVLAKAAREDTAWNVRFTALETLAARAPLETAVAALRAARSDPDARVSALAERRLKRLVPGGD